MRDVFYLYGAKNQIRTGDPSLFRGMLYQLSYLGEDSDLTTKTPILANTLT